MKISIVDLMYYYYGEDYVNLNLQGKHFPCKHGTPKKITKKHRILKISGLIAACFICIFSVTIALTLSLWTQANGGQNTHQEGGAKTSWESSISQSLSADADITSNTQSVSSSIEDQKSSYDEAVCILSSKQADAVLSVSNEHIEDFKIDTPYPVTIKDFDEEITLDFGTAIYSYYDNTQHTYGYDGLIWQIIAKPISELDQFYEFDWDELCYTINVRLLGYDENYFYQLVCLGMLTKKDHQYDSENITSLQSYYEHTEYGIIVIEDFIEQNKLKTRDNVIEWKSWYIREIMGPIKKCISEKLS